MSHQLKRSVLQVKGDFDALLNADSGKSATTKQPPVLLDLRKSGSFKPQSSQDSAASFATAPSSSSDVVSEAAGPTHSSSALGSALARHSSPLKPGPAAADPSAGDQLLQKHSSNGAAERSAAAGASAAGAREASSEPMTAAEDEHPDSIATAEMQSRQQMPSSSPALNGSRSKMQPMKADGDPSGLQEGHRADFTHSDKIPPALNQHASAAENRSLAETASVAQQDSSVQDAPAQEAQRADSAEGRQPSAAGFPDSSSLSTTMQPSEAQDSTSAGDSHPLEPQLPGPTLDSPMPAEEPKQDAEKGSARLHDSLQSSNHEALSNSTAEVLEPSSTAAASQGQTITSNSSTSTQQASKSAVGLQTTAAAAGDRQSTSVPEQATSTAFPEHSNSSEQSISTALGSGQPEEAPAEGRAAEPGQRFEDAQGQLSFSRGPEASEELPVSTLGARWLSGILPDQESSAAGDSPAAEAAAHGEGPAEPDEDLAHEQQGTLVLLVCCPCNVAGTRHLCHLTSKTHLFYASSSALGERCSGLLSCHLAAALSIYPHLRRCMCRQRARGRGAEGMAASHSRVEQPQRHAARA